MDKKLTKNPLVLIPLFVGIAFIVLAALGTPVKFWWYLVFLVLYIVIVFLIKMPDALGTMAVIASQSSKKPDAGWKLFEAAYNKGCKVPAALQGYGYLLIARGEYEKGREVYERLLTQKPSEIPPFVLKHSRVTYSIALWKCGRLEDAIGVLEQMRVDYEYFDADFYTTLGFYYFEAGNVEKAREMAELALKETPNYGPTLDNLGQIAFAEGNLDEAEALFREALEQKPQMVDAYYHLGLIAEAEGDLEHALARYQRAATCPLNGFKTLTAEQIQAKIDAVTAQLKAEA